MKELLLELGIEKIPFIGGIIGAIAAISNIKKPFCQKISPFIIGVLSACYISPLIWELMDLKNDQSKAGIAVFIGYIGLKGIEQIITKKLNDK